MGFNNRADDIPTSIYDCKIYTRARPDLTKPAERPCVRGDRLFFVESKQRDENFRSNHLGFFSFSPPGGKGSRKFSANDPVRLLARPGLNRTNSEAATAAVVTKYTRYGGGGRSRGTFDLDIRAANRAISAASAGNALARPRDTILFLFGARAFRVGGMKNQYGPVATRRDRLCRACSDPVRL